MKIFLSSTYNDLKEIRRSALNYLEGITGHISNATGEVVAMEYFHATERTCKEECLYNLSSSDLVIGIYGNTYGSIDEETGLSMTEVEFDYAIDKHIPILGFVMKGNGRDEREKKFIEEKVYGRGIVCANFENATHFTDQLDGTLKEYLKGFDGYSIDSLWENVTSLKELIEQKIANEDSGFELQMVPFISGDEDAAIEQIISCARKLKEYAPELISENSAVHLYAYMFKHHPDEIDDCTLVKLQRDVEENTDIILGNWERVHHGLRNHAATIILATLFLKLKRMQMRLLTERWSESLRQEVIRARAEYETAIVNSRYSD